MNNIDTYKSDLKSLLDTGSKLLSDFMSKKNNATFFHINYQNWFTESQEVIKQIIPFRLDEFKQLYDEPKRKIINNSTYSIKDWLLGLRASTDYVGKPNFDDYAAAVMRLQSQVAILKSAEIRFQSRLFEIKQLVQADLLDTELEVAGELNKKGFNRAAGAIAGVVLESHLKQVCDNHSITINKKAPGINDLNQLLKDNNVIEIPDWRYIQHLGDIRNLCDHGKDKEPTKEQISDLIKGVEKITKTVF